MEGGASLEPETTEVLPQHKFDTGSLEAYLNQHLPGFGAEPEAHLTVAQYRYRRRPSPPAETNLYSVLFFLWPTVGSQFPPVPASFPALTRSVGGGYRQWSPAFHPGYFQFEVNNGSTTTFMSPAMRRNLC